MSFFKKLLRIIAIILLIIALIFLIWYALSVGAVGFSATKVAFSVAGFSVTYGGLLIYGIMALTLSVVLDSSVFGSVIKRFGEAASSVVKAVGSVLTDVVSTAAKTVLSGPMNTLLILGGGYIGLKYLTRDKSRAPPLVNTQSSKGVDNAHYRQVLPGSHPDPGDQPGSSAERSEQPGQNPANEPVADVDRFEHSRRGVLA